VTVILPEKGEFYERFLKKRKSLKIPETVKIIRWEEIEN
jgi:hypothetical protein